MGQNHVADFPTVSKFLQLLYSWSPPWSPAIPRAPSHPAILFYSGACSSRTSLRHRKKNKNMKNQHSSVRTSPIWLKMRQPKPTTFPHHLAPTRSPGEPGGPEITQNNQNSSPRKNSLKEFPAGIPGFLEKKKKLRLLRH